MNNCQEWIKKHRVLIGQVTCFYLGKTFIGFIELPNDTKNISYVPILMVSAVLYLLAFILKLYKEGRDILKALIPTYLRLFIIWIVSLLSTIFSFSLSHELGWSMLEIITQTICQILTTSTLVIFCHFQFTSKVEFIAYQALLALNILALGIKTVIFIEYDIDSPHKDMVLLNLTTRIALAIIIMDAIERAYEKKRARESSRNTLVEQQMSVRNESQ